MQPALQPYATPGAQRQEGLRRGSFSGSALFANRDEFGTQHAAETRFLQKIVRDPEMRKLALGLVAAQVIFFAPYTATLSPLS